MGSGAEGERGRGSIRRRASPKGSADFCFYYNRNLRGEGAECVFGEEQSNNKHEKCNEDEYKSLKEHFERRRDARSPRGGKGKDMKGKLKPCREFLAGLPCPRADRPGGCPFPHENAENTKTEAAGNAAGQ